VPDSVTAPGHPTGYDLLCNPRLNKGTAYSAAERQSTRKSIRHLNARNVAIPQGITRIAHAPVRHIVTKRCKRGKSHGDGMILRFTGRRESDSFWQWFRRPDLDRLSHAELTRLVISQFEMIAEL
jgi:hypothetical protein